jgi:phage-related protein
MPSGMWRVLVMPEAVDELAELADDQQARFLRIKALIEERGLEHVGLPHVRHIEGPLWEMRLKGRGGIARALYVTGKSQRVFVVRVFVKKTAKTPKREIKLALGRAEDIE